MHRGRSGGVLLAGVALFFTLVLVVDRALPAGPLRPLTSTVYQWLLLVGGSALLLGVLNVAAVHLRRILQGQPEWLASVALLAALVAVMVVGLLDPAGDRGAALAWLFDSIIAPGQATLFALLAFFLVAAAYRYLRIGRAGGAWMLAGALLMLLAQMPASQQWLLASQQWLLASQQWLLASQQWLPGLLASWMAWLLEYPVMAALRGAILGSSLALAVVAFYLLLNRGKG